MTTQTQSAPQTLDVPVPGESQRPFHLLLAVLALAAGGFAIGTTEFVTMGVLPQIADGVGVSIPAAGHLISAYALGVVVGAPVIAFFGAKLPRRALLVALMGTYAVLNAVSAAAPGYGSLLVARFVDGLPHGGYFGVASLVAASLVAPERRGRAIAWVMTGLTVANVVGVPAATWLGQHLGWRASYLTVAALGVVAVTLIAIFVPHSPGNPRATGRSELSAFRQPQVWFMIVAGSIGFGGIFALYSYIAPLVTVAAGLDESAVPVFVLSMGLGMVVGTSLAGYLVDWSLRRTVLGSPVATAIALLVLWVLVPLGWVAVVGVFVVMAVASGLSLGLMLQLIDASGDAQTIGAATAHAALNVGNAVGAWLGGVAIAAGWGYRSPLLVGAGLTVAGFVVLVAAAVADRRSSGVTS